VALNEEQGYGIEEDKPEKQEEERERFELEG
jgi:hypothetical protein